MAKDKESFRRGSFLDGGIPDHNALGWSESSNVGVQRSDFLTGFHQEHAIARNVEAAFCCYALNLCDQFRIGLVQGFKLVEHRVDDDGGNHDQEDDAWHGFQPEVKPPAPRTLSDVPDHEE